jgi:hypothetical protein
MPANMPESPSAAPAAPSLMPRKTAAQRLHDRCRGLDGVGERGGQGLEHAHQAVGEGGDLRGDRLERAAQRRSNAVEARGRIVGDRHEHLADGGGHLLYLAPGVVLEVAERLLHLLGLGGCGDADTGEECGDGGERGARDDRGAGEGTHAALEHGHKQACGLGDAADGAAEPVAFVAACA